MIISEKNQKSNRQNAQHSTGPKTTEGKAAIRFNAPTVCAPAPRLLPALGRTGSRLATPNPHRTLLPGNHGHLPMVAKAGCRERTEDLRVHRIRRTAVQNVGLRRETAALLPPRHRGHAPVATGAPGPPAAASKTRAGAGSQASRAAGSAPRVC